jgi:hypothetical protein
MEKAESDLVHARATQALSAQATLYVIAKKKKKGLFMATHCVAIDLKGFQAETCLRKARDMVPALRTGTVVILTAYVQGIEWEWRYEVT